MKIIGIFLFLFMIRNKIKSFIESVKSRALMDIKRANENIALSSDLFFDETYNGVRMMIEVDNSAKERLVNFLRLYAYEKNKAFEEMKLRMHLQKLSNLNDFVIKSKEALKEKIRKKCIASKKFNEEFDNKLKMLLMPNSNQFQNAINA